MDVILLLVAILSVLVAHQSSVECHKLITTDLNKLLNYCMDSKHHKKEPSKEPRLARECKPWANNACCHENSTRDAHMDVNHYNLDVNHCESVTNRKMSPKCQQFFVRDTCFFDCEPNIGPWVVQVNRKFATERFKDVPLCQSECTEWFNACSEDYTCAYNWAKHLNWRDGVSTCKRGSDNCRKIGEVYANANDFCEAVWDYSWKVMPDNTPCMRLSFDSRDNPNRRAAKAFLSHEYGISAANWHSPAGIMIASTLLLALICRQFH